MSALLTHSAGVDEVNFALLSIITEDFSEKRVLGEGV
jgi:hypothetical protein